MTNGQWWWWWWCCCCWKKRSYVEGWQCRARLEHDRAVCNLFRANAGKARKAKHWSRFVSEQARMNKRQETWIGPFDAGGGRRGRGKRPRNPGDASLPIAADVAAGKIGRGFCGAQRSGMAETRSMPVAEDMEERGMGSKRSNWMM